MRVLLSTTLALGLTLTSMQDAAQSGQMRMSTEQIAHLNLIMETCKNEIEPALKKLEAAARRTHKSIVYHAMTPEGMYRTVTRDEFLERAVTDCSLQGVAQDPLLAPLFVEPPVQEIIT